MLGFDALGRLALGQLPNSANTTLIAAAGSFALTGQAATFTISEAVVVGSIALTGQAATFTTSEAIGTGSFAYAGVATPFTTSEALGAGNFAFTGQATTDSITEPLSVGTFAFGGISATFTISEALGAGSYTISTSTTAIILEADAPGAFVLTGNDAALSVFLFGGVGDGGRDHDAENDWDNHRRKREALRKSIRRARRQIEGGPDIASPVRGPVQFRQIETSTPLQIPRVDLDFNGAVATLHDIAAQLSTLESAFAQRPQQTVQTAPEPTPQVASNDDEAAVAALLMVA